MASKKNKKHATQHGNPQRPSQRNSGGKTQQQGNRSHRQGSNVPPLDAFDNVPKRTPPNLPGRNEDRHDTVSPEPQRPQQKISSQKMATQKQDAEKPKKKQQSKKRRRQNAAKRRRNRRIAAIIVIFLLIGVGVWYSVTVLFKIEKIVVENLAEGELPYSQEEFEAALPANSGDNLFEFSASNAQKQIEEQLPYVATVTIRRRLPDTVILRITPAQERYYMPWESGFAVISNTQKTLRMTEEEPTHLVRINGLIGVKPVPGKKLMVEETVLAEQKQQALAYIPPQTEEVSPPVEEPEDLPEDTVEAQVEDTQQEDAGENSEAPPEEQEVASVPEGEPIPEEVPPVEESIPVPAVAPPAVLLLLETDALLEEANSRVDSVNLLIDALEKTGLEEIAWLDVSEPLNLMFRWQDRITVVLGAPNGMDEKMKAVQIMLTDAEQSDITDGDRGILDVSFYLTTKEIRFRRE